MSKKFEMKFDPKTIEHLGVRMYSTLPPALAELISNAYDADASSVTLRFHEGGGKPLSINVIDDGHGMSAFDIQEKFLVIGRNRRKDDGDKPTALYNRLPTGKKGLGKLALFGLAKVITVDTVKAGRRNRFVLDWDALMNAEGSYNPIAEVTDQETDKSDGTIIKLSKLKRLSLFDLEGLADSLSKIFIVDNEFSIRLVGSDGVSLFVDNDRRYAQLNKQFEWDVDSLVPGDSFYKGKVEGKLYTAETPIKPNSGLRGVSIFSRGKLVNAPEFFSSSTSSHFFQYLTGWIRADFIDLLTEDVISTNRQSINWDNEDMQEFRVFLSDLIAKVNSSWRGQRKEKKDEDLKSITGIDTQKWMSTMPEDIQAQTAKILDALVGEDAFSKFTPVIEALHKIIPEYPQLHWRYLNENLKGRVKAYYENAQYGDAADQSVKIYCEYLRSLTGLLDDGTDLTGKVFSSKTNVYIEIDNLKTTTGVNMQEGQDFFSRGLIKGFRNPVSHAPLDVVVPKIFTELDCLNILSLTSYLMDRVERGRVIKN
ncbi:TIGR02391 family protein [Pseudomonas alliivorans]|nr:TIGR02391 family protein [Pseudomonas alliivorans]MEE4873431.1 TIGR02391 family protein [Pseudomonas alliivorans]